MATTGGKTTVTRTAQIERESSTVTDITDGALKVGAPTTATVTTTLTGIVMNPNDTQKYTITYSWTEEV